VIWIDTDVALGSSRGDVDDAFALAAVAADPSVKLLGVSSVFGNTDAESAARNARSLLIAAGRGDVPVVVGASRRGQRSAATEAIAALPQGAHLLALGPLTNVSAAIAERPGLLSQLASCSFVGGNLSSRGFLPPVWPHEFNLSQDLEAAKAVLAAEGPRRLYPLDVVGRLRFRSEDLLVISLSGPLGVHLSSGSGRWMLRAQRRMRTSFPVWDLVPALDLLLGWVARTETRRYALVGGGRLVEDDTAPPLEVARGFDALKLKQAFLEGLRDSRFARSPA
jgi:inosine-uridine nucleoside N-ribohydrolase